MNADKPEQKPSLPGEIRAFMTAKRVLRFAECISDVSGLAWSPLSDTDPRAQAMADAVQQSAQKAIAAGMRAGIRNGTIHNWAAKLTLDYMQKSGFSAEGAANYASSYAHFIASMPTQDAMRVAQRLGLEPAIPDAAEIERMAAVAERGKMAQALRVLEDLKSDLATGQVSDAASILNQLKVDIPELRQKTGFALQMFENGSTVPREHYFASFEEAVVAFRNTSSTSAPKLVYDGMELVAHNTNAQGAPLRFLNDKIEEKYLNTLLQGTGKNIEISANQNGQLATIRVQGAASEFRQFAEAIANNSVSLVDEQAPEQKKPSGPRMR